MEIVLASRNKKKITEMQALLTELCNTEIKILSLDDIGYEGDIEEDGESFEENAAIKASVPARMGYFGISDDSGLAVDHLNGAPGIFSARYSGEGATDEKNNAKLMAEMEGVEDRGAAYVSVIAFSAPSDKFFGKADEELSAYSARKGGCDLKTVSFRGECRGELLCEYRGNGGFGYDPMFLVHEYERTFAEITQEEKNKISHRGKALRSFAKWLNENLE
jgi:XTP/dITP diphosphohydrolase